MSDIEPSSLRDGLRGGIFIPGAFGKAELEFAAMLLIHYCAEMGNKWQGVSWPEMQKFLKARDQLPEWKILHNPFFRPDFRGLVPAGLATCPLAALGPENPISRRSVVG